MHFVQAGGRPFSLHQICFRISQKSADSHYAFRVFYDFDNCKNKGPLASGVAKISNDPCFNIYSGHYELSWLELFTQAGLFLISRSYDLLFLSFSNYRFILRALGFLGYPLGCSTTWYSEDPPSSKSNLLHGTRPSMHLCFYVQLTNFLWCCSRYCPCPKLGLKFRPSETDGHFLYADQLWCS